LRATPSPRRLLLLPKSKEGRTWTSHRSPAASLLCTLVVGALTFFIKKTLATLEEADKRNAAQIAEAKKEAAEKIAKVEEKLNDLKADLPLVYVTREDYIRVMNRVEDKLDQILYGKGKGKEE
jgi:hypothetical protein